MTATEPTTTEPTATEPTTTESPTTESTTRPTRTPRRAVTRRPLVSLLAAAFLAALALVVGGSGASAATLPTYQVTVSGTASGNPFRVTGLLYLGGTVTNVTTNGVNPYEVCLKVGFPAGTPRTGAIWYGSNSACFSSRGSNIDMVYASASGSSYTTQPDGRLQATYINNWTTSNSLAACLFSPVSGSTNYTITATGVSGRIQLSGFGGAFCGWSTYSATLSGVRIA